MMCIVQVFELMAKRESIKRSVEKKCAEFYSIFLAEINIVKKQFDIIRRSPPNHPILPKYAGSAM